MNDYVLLLLGSFSLIAIVTLSLFLYLLYKGNSNILYSFPHPDARSFWHVLLVVISAASLLVCFYQGVLFALAWLPELFGTEGHKVSWIVAILFTGTAGMLLLAFMAENLVWRTEMEFSEERIRVLEDTIDALLHKERKDIIRHDFEAAITAITSEESRPEQLLTSSKKSSLSYRRLEFYHRLMAKLSSI